MTTFEADVVFGRTYRDRISGFVGTATGFCSYISGCDQVLLVPPAKDGELKAAHWFDDERLIDVATEKAIRRTSRKGGPEQSPPAR